MTTLNLAQVVREGQARERGRIALENIAAKYTEKLTGKFSLLAPKAKSENYSDEFRAFLKSRLGYTPTDATIDFIVLHYL